MLNLYICQSTSIWAAFLVTPQAWGRRPIFQRWEWWERWVRGKVGKMGFWIFSLTHLLVWMMGKMGFQKMGKMGVKDGKDGFERWERWVSPMKEKCTPSLISWFYVFEVVELEISAREAFFGCFLTENTFFSFIKTHHSHLWNPSFPSLEPTFPII